MYDEEIEKAVLYFVIIEKQDFDLNVDDFVCSRNRKIIIAINQLKAEKAEISILNVANKIKGNNSEILQYISDLGNFIYGTSAETAYSKLIDYSKKRQVYEMTKKLQETITDDENIDNLIEKNINKLTKIQQRNEKNITFSEQVIESMNEIEKNYANQSDTSLYTGLLELDKILLGLHKQELTVIGARPRYWKNNYGFTDCRTYCKKKCMGWICKFGDVRNTIGSKNVSKNKQSEWT